MTDARSNPRQDQRETIARLSKDIDALYLDMIETAEPWDLVKERVHQLAEDAAALLEGGDDAP